MIGLVVYDVTNRLDRDLDFLPSRNLTVTHSIIRDSPILIDVSDFKFSKSDLNKCKR
jgi:hypothetical protein